jgi:hypothetical protein
MTKSERQAELTYYGFICDCDACKFDYPFLRGINRSFTAIGQKAAHQLKFLQQIEQTGRELLPEVFEIMLEDCCTQLMNIHKTCKDKKKLDVNSDVIIIRLVLLYLLMSRSQPRIKIP